MMLQQTVFAKIGLTSCSSLQQTGSRSMNGRIQSYNNRKFRLVPCVMDNYSATGTKPISDRIYGCIRLFMKRTPGF